MAWRWLLPSSETHEIRELDYTMNRIIPGMIRDCSLISVAVLIWLLLGCGPMKPTSIHFVIPDDFIGRIDIVHDSAKGMPLEQNHNALTIEIPKSGQLQVRSLSVLQSPHTLSASFRSGRQLPVNLDNATSNDARVCLWPLGSISGTHFPQKTFQFIVGTATQRDNIADAIRRQAMGEN